MGSTTRREENEGGAWREASAVVLICVGLMTLLSLASYNAADISLNATGQGAVRNWIGPAGGYWADLLLQAIGLGAYALGAGLMLAGSRAFAGRRILPGMREASGIVLLMVAVGLLAQLILWGQPRPYPPGGVLGAIFGQVLRARFAPLGAYILSGSLLLLAMTLTAEGVLIGLGGHGWHVLQRVWQSASAAIAGLRDMAQAWRKAREKRPKPRLQVVPDTSVGNKRRNVRVSRPSAELALVPNAPDGNVDAAEEDEEAEAETPKARAARARKPSLAQVAPPLPPVPLEVAPLVESAPEPSAQAPRAPRAKAVNEPNIVDVRPDRVVDAASLDRVLPTAEIPAEAKQFELPPTSLLDFQATVRQTVDPKKLRENAERLMKTLNDYGIDGHVREIRPGPVVTMYEYVPGPGIKLSKIASLSDDLAMSMEATRVRIVAPIPGKGAVGIEIPNETRETVYLKEIIGHDAFRNAKSRLTMALGKDIEGAAYVADLARMPHLLVAGATGAGKSVSINAMIMSVLFKATPAEVRMIMVDPKMLELSVYEGIPHLLLPVVTDPKKAALALRWAVEEMERRYELLSEVGVRSIDGYNTKVRAAAERGEAVTIANPVDADLPPKVCEPLPYLLVIVDELADLMMVASREVESSIMRLAQMARASGIHLILATQRPSVDVLTGVIKANFPTRIAFQVASRHDSRTIIDANGAEHLLGAGDMLYLSPGAGGMLRVHGAYVSDEEIERAVSFLRKQGSPQYDESILAPRADEGEDGEEAEVFQDEMYDQAVAIVAETRQASISMIQRRMRIGYNRAARMVERMETEGIVGPADGAKPRDVLVSSLSA